ncbi:MAG: EutN/CcmL family microcompartment protein [Myxococcales bacterium]|nr:EutN/CcmL family microcompartment protein [Myxococcota bacterium]MDW8281016.1 EutN/CcmL family microcompartment protein [Myxococcales bacterium]
MILGRVIGEVWAARQHPGLLGKKLLIIRPHGWYDPPLNVGHLVAVDPVGAGAGEDVVVCMGDPGRRVLAGGLEQETSPLLPVDATVMAIVDRVELDPKAPLRFGGPPPRGAA